MIEFEDEDLLVSKKDEIVETGSYVISKDETRLYMFAGVEIPIYTVRKPLKQNKPKASRSESSLERKYPRSASTSSFEIGVNNSFGDRILFLSYVLDQREVESSARESSPAATWSSRGSWKSAVPKRELGKQTFAETEGNSKSKPDSTWAHERASKASQHFESSLKQCSQKLSVVEMSSAMPFPLCCVVSDVCLNPVSLNVKSNPILHTIARGMLNKRTRMLACKDKSGIVFIDWTYISARRSEEGSGAALRRTCILHIGLNSDMKFQEFYDQECLHSINPLSNMPIKYARFGTCNLGKIKTAILYNHVLKQLDSFRFGALEGLTFREIVSPWTADEAMSKIYEHTASTVGTYWTRLAGWIDTAVTVKMLVSAFRLQENLRMKTSMDSKSGWIFYEMATDSLFSVLSKRELDNTWICKTLTSSVFEILPTVLVRTEKPFIFCTMLSNNLTWKHKGGDALEFGDVSSSQRGEESAFNSKNASPQETEDNLDEYGLVRSKMDEIDSLRNKANFLRIGYSEIFRTTLWKDVVCYSKHEHEERDVEDCITPSSSEFSIADVTLMKHLENVKSVNFPCLQSSKGVQ